MIILIKRRIRQGLVVLILIAGISSGLIIHTVGNSSRGAADVLQVHLKSNTNILYYAEQFNMSLTIVNVHGFEDVLDVSIRVEIPQELELLSTNIPELELENITDKISYDFGRLAVDGRFRFQIRYNVISDETKSLSIPAANVSFKLKNGITGFVLSNSENVRLSGKKLTTTTESLLPIPVGKLDEIDLILIKFPASPFFSIIGYLFPLLFFSMSIIVLRRLRYIKT